MPFPPYPATPAPFTWLKDSFGDAARLRSDVVNAVLLLTEPPLFAGAQTGVPAPFTAVASTDTFTAPGTAYIAGQAVIFTGSSLPGGVTAGTVYFVTNPQDGGQFQINNSGGTLVNVTSNGSGLVQQTQQLATSSPPGTVIWNPVNLDTEVSDAWAGHLTTANPSQYYAQFPGWYLAEFTAPLSYSGGIGSVSAGIIAQEGTSPAVTIGGQRAKTSGTASRFVQPSAAKLLQFSVTGPNAGPGVNWVQGAVYQDTGAAQTLVATGTRYAQLQLEWLCALTGDPSLPVPSNDAWPQPPDVVGRTFLNTNVRDTISFLAYRPVLEAVRDAGTFSLPAQSALPATGTTIPLDTVHVDTRSAFNAGTGVWTVAVPGLYDVYGQVPVTAATTSTAVAAGLTVKSANYNSGSTFTVWGAPQAAYTTAGQVNCAPVRRRLRLALGDTVAVAGFQADSGSHAAVIAAATWKARLISIWRAF